MDERGKTVRSLEQEALFEASGKVELTGKLDAFLYLLMRDHLPPGVVAGIVKDLTGGQCNFTNGWLARYAEYLACDLRENSSERSVELLPSQR